MFIIAYLIFFVFLFTRCKKYASPVLDYVLGFYVVAAICGVLMHFGETDNPCTLFSFLYQTIIFICFLKPIILYGKHERERKIILISDRRFKYLVYILTGLQLFTIVFFAGYVSSLFLRGDLSQIRSEILATGEDALGASLGRTIAGTASFFYCYNILLFFYSLAFRHDKKWLLLLLIFSSTSRIFHALTYMGRDGLLFWILSFLFSFFLFKPYLNYEAKKLIRKVFFVCGTFALLLIGAITLSRFGESDNGVLWSLIAYLGQPMDNFAKMFHSDFDQWEGTQSIFPLLFGEKQQDTAELLESANAFEAMFGFRNNVFYSFVGNMYMAWGPVISLLISVGYSAYMSRILNKACSSLSIMIVLMIATQIVVNNYFYWAYYIRVANLFLIMTPLFVIYCNNSNTNSIIEPYSNEQ